MTPPTNAAAERGWTALRCSANPSLSRWRSWATAAPGLERLVARAREGDTEDHQPLAGQPEAVERVPGAGASLQRGAEQVGAQPALDVGSGAHPEQVQRDQLRRLAQRVAALLAERSGDRGPDRAQHLVPRPHRDRHPGHGERVLPVRDRADEHRAVAPVELAEDPALGEDPRVALGHLPPQDRLDPGGVRLVLAPREGQDPGAAVLDGDRGVEQRGDGVRDGEQVAGRQSPQGLVLGGTHVVLREQGAQHRGQMRPRRPAAEPEQGDARRVGGPADRRGQRHRGADDECGGTGAPELAQQLRHLIRVVEADTEHERAVRQHRDVHGIVDHDAADLLGRLGVAVDEVQQGGAQVVEDAAEAGARLRAAGGHGQSHLRGHSQAGDGPETTSAGDEVLRYAGGRGLRSAGRSVDRHPRRG